MAVGITSQNKKVRKPRKKAAPKEDKKNEG